MRRLFSLAAVVLCGALFIHSQDDPFLEKPYLQLGDRPKEAASEGLSLLWHAAPDESIWQVQIATSPDKW